jgi:hypothetical protein
MAWSTQHFVYQVVIYLLQYVLADLHSHHQVEIQIHNGECVLGRGFPFTTSEYVCLPNPDRVSQLKHVVVTVWLHNIQSAVLIENYHQYTFSVTISSCKNTELNYFISK